MQKDRKKSTFMSKFKSGKFWDLESLGLCKNIFKLRNCLKKMLFMKTISKYVVSFYLLTVR